MRRRHFLQGTGATAGAALVGARPGFAAAGFRERLGVTSDEISDDLEAALAFVRSFGLQWVELRRLWGQYVTELSLDDCKRARALLDRHKVRVSVLDTALYKCDLPGAPSGRKEDYPYDAQPAVLGRALERAAILGTRYIRIFSFWRARPPAVTVAAATSGAPVPAAQVVPAPAPAQAPAGPLPDPATLARIVDHLGKASERARAAGATLLLENVNGANAETSAESARVLAAIRSPAFGLAWDPNNAYCGRETPFPDGYRTLDHKRILHVHLRDADWGGDKRCRWLPVGKGQVDNLGLLRALRKDGFRGTLTLETHYSRPDGNKELATRESLAGLLAVLQKV
jgi:L-ribulose-5-phosphate 3-epimerase